MDIHPGDDKADIMNNFFNNKISSNPSISSVSSEDYYLSTEPCNPVPSSPRKLTAPPPIAFEYSIFSNSCTTPISHYHQKQNQSIVPSRLLGTALVSAAASASTFAIVRTSAEILMANTLSLPLRMQPIFPSAPIVSFSWWVIVLTGGAALGGTHVFTAGATAKFFRQFLPTYRFVSVPRSYTTTRSVIHDDVPSVIGFSIMGLLSSSVFYKRPFAPLIQAVFFSSVGSVISSITSSLLKFRKSSKYVPFESQRKPPELRRSWASYFAEEVTRYVRETDRDVRLTDRTGKVMAGMAARSASVLAGAAASALLQFLGIENGSRKASLLISLFGAMNFELAWCGTLRGMEWWIRHRCTFKRKVHVI